MCETGLTPLDALLLAAELSGELKIDDLNAKSKPITGQNEDEFFLSKIATNDLRAFHKTTTTKEVVGKSTEIKKKGKTRKSLIHGGDTDSSDDEINRNHENAKYNECGKELRHLLPEIKEKTEYPGQISSTWRQKAVKSVAPLKEDIITDPFFGIRISKPLISSAVLAERMTNRTAVTMSRVKLFIQSIGQTSDWVIAGCIVQKSPVKTSQKGAQYLIWTLSDLQNDLQSVSVFLFKHAYKQLWKSSIGTVVGILNPSILENREGARQEATLSVDNHEKVMVFGQSKDFGICKSNKKDGTSCTAFVNLNRCSFCLYHVRQEYQKCSQRSELQSKLAGQGLTGLRNKVLGKNEVFYAGKSYMAIPAKKNPKLLAKDNKRMNELHHMGLVTSAPAPLPKKTFRQGAAASLDSSRSQRLKDLEMIKRLTGAKVVSNPLNKSINNETDTAKLDLSVRKVANETETEKTAKTALYVAKYKAKITATNCNESNDSNLERTAETILGTSRQSALDVIANLKARNSLKTTNNNGTLSKPIDSILKCNDLSSETSISAMLRDSSIITTHLTKDDAISKVKADQNISKPSKLSTTKHLTPESDSQKMTQNYKLDVSKNDLKPNNKTAINKEASSEIDLDYEIDASKLKFFKELKSSPAPTLSKPQNSFIDLSTPFIPPRSDKAKLKALQWVQKNGRITNEGTQKSGVKRFLENSGDPKAKRPKVEEKTVFTDRYKKIMAMTSKHTDLLDQHDLEQQEKYFDKLEVREKMEEKMMSTYKIECKAVKCLNCKYTSFSASDRCKQEKHHLKVFNAVKRFFKCGNCGNRTCALEILPLFSCKNCRCTSWERTTMMKEKKVHIGEVLSIRGGEQKFLAAVQTGSNINLLVPED